MNAEAGDRRQAGSEPLLAPLPQLRGASRRIGGQYRREQRNAQRGRIEKKREVAGEQPHHRAGADPDNRCRPAAEVAQRRAFLTEGEARLAGARKAGATASTVLFDLDHFKGFNDNYGHETGDRVLRAFAECATQILRPDDLFGRIGGEEFAALLIGVGGESAQAVAERLRRAVEGIQLSKDGARLRVSVSAGVSTALTSERHLTEMLRQSDRALYRAKSRGRNRVERNEPFAGLAA